MRSEHSVHPWELALLLAVALTLVWGAVFGEPRCGAWWGTVYPELSVPAAAAEASALGGSKVVLRLQLLDWLRSLMEKLPR